MLDKLAIIDIETTGERSHQDSIIEIGIIFVDGNEVTHTYNTLVNPQQRLSPFIENYTGIKSEDLEYAPTFYEIKDELFDMLYDRIFVAHNARFDYSFIKNSFKRHDVKFSAKQLCTVKLSRNLFPQFRNHNLDSIIERYNINCENRHRALGDAKATWEFLDFALKNTPTETLDSVLSKILKKPSIPLYVNQNLIEELPESHGVYIFYGDTELPLYVGKSVNIKDRVLSHFCGDLDSEKELKITQQLKDIKYIETGGELGALILESQLIKQLKPVYNRLLRDARVLTTIQKSVSKDGYFTTSLSTANQINPDQFEDILAVFKNNKTANDYLIEVCESYQLCEKLLGIQKVKGACFGYHLKKCKGACINLEKPGSYNLRFLKAFEEQRLKSWLFSNAIIVTESSDDIVDRFVFNNWSLIGKLDESGEIIYETNNSSFDYDLYKILNRYLNKNKLRRNIKQINLNKYINNNLNSLFYS